MTGMQRVRWSSFYDGRIVTTHYNDGRLFKICKDPYRRGWSIKEKVGNGTWVLRYHLYEENYNNPSNYGLWDNEKTKELNREFLLNSLGVLEIN